MKICYINLLGYGLLDREYAQKQPYGGAEVAMHTDAHELAKDNGFEVHILAQADKEQKYARDNVTMWTFRGNIRVARIAPRLKYYLSIWKKMKEINADTYLYRGATGEIYFLIGIFCALYKKKCIHVLGIVPPKFPFGPIRYLRWKLLLQAGLQLTDAIVALACEQIPKLRASLRGRIKVIYTGKKIAAERRTKRSYFLWVGRERPEKRPRILAKIAEEMPENRFVMIGTTVPDPPKNLKCIKEVPNEQMNKHYSNAIATISTSELEGFSNVYLESWNNGTPVIALEVDTDSAIKKHDLGYHSGTAEQLIIDIKKIQDKKVWLRKSQNASRYIRENHDLKKQTEKYKQLFRELI